MWALADAATVPSVEGKVLFSRVNASETEDGKHRVAVLEPGKNSEGLWLPGVGLVALLFGLAPLIWIVPAVAK